MENLKIAKQILDYQKAAFDNNFNSVSVVQEQTEKMVSNFLQQAPWLPAEAKEAITNWVNAYKKGREEFKKTTDKNYEKVAEYFSKKEDVPETKAKKAK